MQIIKLALPQILNVMFSILCIIYLQLRGQIINLLIPQIIFLAFGIIFTLTAIRKTTQNIQQIDHSPMFFTILLLLQFASLLYLSEDNLSENLLSLLFGNMLQLQKLKSTEKNEKKQFLNIKILLQAVALLLIFIVLIIFKHMTNHIEYFIIAAIMILIVCSYEFLLSNNKNQPQQIEQSKTIVQRRVSVPIQSQYPPQNPQSIWEKFIEQQYIFVSYRNNEVVIEKMSSSLMQILKEKTLTIEEYLKKIQLFNIALESEHILTNNMLLNQSTNLYSYIKDQIIDEKYSAVIQRRKSQRDINDDQQLQKLVSPQNEQRSRLQSVQKSEANLQKGNTLNLNNSSLQYIDREFLSGSVMKNLDNFIAKPAENNNQVPTKKPLYGIIQFDKPIYKKIQFNYWNQGLIIQMEDDSIENIKTCANNVQNGYKTDVTQKQIQKLLQMIENLQQKFNNLLSPQMKENKLFCQAQLQLYVVDVSIHNFYYFLCDGLAFPKQDQLNLIKFLKAIKTKFSQDTTVVEKSIDIKIQDDLTNKMITTDVRYLRQIVVNLLVNSIKAYKKPDISNMVQIHVSQIANEDIKFEIYDKASGFPQPLDYKRVSEGKLGIFIVQKLLPLISKSPKLYFKTVHFENNQAGSSISFLLQRQMNPINNSLQNSSNNLLQQENCKLAQILQSQLVTQQQEFI
ncbi:unnamed protein product [Paramecium octaurelia]|uniref:Histidine kinase domain-containing protein n=1 Tax=Paramecium octaurelia TaxID=43137 RepID=A0A8S1U3Q2_PAROT|nr:unnamed protein product [Paramecium octaurelia]